MHSKPAENFPLKGGKRKFSARGHNDELIPRSSVAKNLRQMIAKSFVYQ